MTILAILALESTFQLGKANYRLSQGGGGGGSLTCLSPTLVLRLKALHSKDLIDTLNSLAAQPHFLWYCFNIFMWHSLISKIWWKYILSWLINPTSLQPYGRMIIFNSLSQRQWIGSPKNIHTMYLVLGCKLRWYVIIILDFPTPLGLIYCDPAYMPPRLIWTWPNLPLFNSSYLRFKLICV